MQLDFEFQDKRRLLLDYDDLKKMGIKFSREQFRRMEMDGHVCNVVHYEGGS